MTDFAFLYRVGFEPTFDWLEASCMSAMLSLNPLRRAVTVALYGFAIQNTTRLYTFHTANVTQLSFRNMTIADQILNFGIRSCSLKLELNSYTLSFVSRQVCMCRLACGLLFSPIGSELISFRDTFHLVFLTISNRIEEPFAGRLCLRRLLVS